MNTPSDFSLYERNIQGFMLLNGYYDQFKSEEEIQKCTESLSKVVDVNTFFNTPIFEKEKDVYNMMVDKLSGKNEDSDIPPCPKCGGERKFKRIQRRSNDEIANNEYHCVSCGSIFQC